jgi:hypothetical protein
MGEQRAKIGLTTAEQFAAQPLALAGKTLKLNDGGGLFLLSTESAKGWPLPNNSAAGKHALLSLGVDPSVSLDQARDRERATGAGYRH